MVDVGAERAIHEQMTLREAKGVPLSTNRRGKGKVLVWVGACHLKGIAENLGRENCCILGVKIGTKTTITAQIGGLVSKSNGIKTDLLIRMPN